MLVARKYTKFNFVVYLRICYTFGMTEHQDNRDHATAQALAGDLRTLMGQFKRMLHDQASLGNMTLSQVSVLGQLDRDGPATVTNLARADGVRPQSMGATVSALETAGLVSGTPDPNDGRQTIWSLTPACRERIRVGRVAREVVPARHPEKAFGRRAGATRERPRAAQAPDRVLTDIVDMPDTRCRCAELTPMEETSMPLTTSIPKTAIIVIDLQKGIVALPDCAPHRGCHFRSRAWPMRSAHTTCRSCWSMLPAARPAATEQPRPPDHLPMDGRTSSLNSAGNPRHHGDQVDVGAFPSTDLEAS